MDAVILSGGLGTRLRPLTLTRPKPLVPVLNVPILEHIVRKLPTDVDRVILAASYRIEDLHAYVKERTSGPEIIIVEERELLGTGGAIKNVERHVRGPFFVFNGDILDSLDLGGFRDFHRARGGIGSIALWRVDDPRPYGVVGLDGSRITSFVEKPASPAEAPSDLANAGTYLLEPEVFDLIPSGRAVSVEREVFPAALSKGGGLHGMPFSGYWVDCGRPETFLLANETLLRHGRAPKTAVAGGDVPPSITSGWIVVGRGARVHSTARLARSVLFDGVVVEDGATVEDCILGEGVRVGAGARLKGVTIGDYVTVDAGAALENVRIPVAG
jgi:mannose-1-phosphate guanylyltransferase